MKTRTAVWCIAMLACSASTAAIAQTNPAGTAGSGSSAPGTAQEAQPGIQPGKAADSMNQMTDPARAGSSAQGSLMQKREQGMSNQPGPEKGINKDANKDKTGQMKQ
jgi:hypothetical protein